MWKRIRQMLELVRHLFTGTETNNEIELQEEFRPAGLSPGEEFCSGEVFKVLMVHDNIDWSWRPFQVVSPTLERFEDGEEFFVVNVVVQLCGGESPGVKSDRMNLVVGRGDCRKNGTESVI